MKSLLIIFSICLIAFSNGCIENRVYENNLTISDYHWTPKDSLIFKIYIEDTNSTYFLSVNVRHFTNYSFTNLWTWLIIKDPAQEVDSSLHELILGSNPDQKWLGSCMRDICEINIPIDYQYRFEIPGEYTFRLLPTMRKPIDDLMSMGIRLEKNK